MVNTDILDTLYVATPGTSLRLEGDTVRVWRPDAPGRRIVPLLRVESIILWHGVDVSADLLHRCATLGIHVTWITQNGRLLASITGHEPGRPDLRLAQYRAYDDPGHRLALARRIVAGKIQNYRQLVLRAARDAQGDRQRELRRIGAVHAEALTMLSTATSLTRCMGIEGMAARAYFDNLHQLIPSSAPGRTRRPPTDPVNCYLSSLYGLLRASIHAALVHVGLDPFVGYLHGCRANKPSLALDLMEEMRPLLVDRLVASLFNRGQIRPAFTRTLPGGAVQLTDAGWKYLLQAWVESRQRQWPHEGVGHPIQAAALPVTQARALARHLREPEFPYTPWRIA